MVDAYHEFSYPREMMEAIIKALKPGGRVVVIEYRGEDPRVAKPPHHKMTEAQTIKEMEAVGLRWRETKNFLPQQHFMVFEKEYKISRFAVFQFINWGVVASKIYSLGIVP
jgi:16S rRNA C1402 N4-methylase RsmH